MTIVIFGSNGYIGSEFYSQLRNIGYDPICLSSQNTNFTSINKSLEKIRPDVVINVSAFVGGTSIVHCELQKDVTIQSNVMFPSMLGEICKNNDVLLCHFSSGCIYDGYPIGGFIESDFPNMTFKTNYCSFYTGTKAMAEECLSSVEKKYIWRIRLPFDEVYDCKRNYLSKLLRFERLITSPNSLTHKKEMVKCCIESILNKIPYGTYNLTNPGMIDAKEISEMMKDILKVKKEFLFFNSQEEYNNIRNIPQSNTHLNTDKLRNAGVIMRPIREAVEETLLEWKWK